MFIITVTPCLTVRDAGFFKAMGLGPQAPNVNIHCSSSSKHLCILCTGAALHRAWSIFPFRAVRKIHPVGPAAVHAALFSKQEFTACNAFSVLAGNLSTASQSSTRIHAERIVATWYHMLQGGHWLPPCIGASGSSACWVSCWPYQLYHCSYPWCQLSCCSHWSLNPRGKLRGWKKMWGAIGTADTFILSWLAWQP